MGRFIRGLVVGMIFGQLLAPMRGQEMRRLLSERVQTLLGYLPDTTSVKQYAQQVADKTSQGMSRVKNTAQQITPQIRDTAANLSNAAQQTTSQVLQTGKDTANSVQQKASSALQDVQEKTPFAKNTTSKENKTSTDPLDRMESVSPEVRDKLEAEGIQSTPQLLENAQTQAERAELANKVGVTHRALREFVYRADLMRLTNLGEDMANVLEEAGVNGCSDLQNRNPEHLHSKLLTMQEEGSIASSVPDIEQITSWIAEAKEMNQSLQK